MTAPSVFVVSPLQRQVDALERENAHLKEMLSVQADRLAALQILNPGPIVAGRAT